jgi:adenosylcobinamide-phosphate synthase
VADAFEVPLDFLMNPAHHRRHAFEWAGQRREWFSMPYGRWHAPSALSGVRRPACCAISTDSWWPERLTHRRYHCGMSFFAILFALLIEQVRPLARHNPVHAWFAQLGSQVSQQFRRGQVPPRLGGLAAGRGAACRCGLGIFWGLAATLGWPFAVLWNVAVLYVTLGFRQFSHHFTDIRDALDAGNEAQARELLAQWQQVDASELPRSEIVRHVIEHSVLAAHRHVFGVLGWFSVLSAVGLGPAGAVLYRMSEFVTRYWDLQKPHQALPASSALQAAAARAWYLIDWVPARVTALGFAVVGSFEEAIDSWRNVAQRFPTTTTASSWRPPRGRQCAPGGRGPAQCLFAQQLAVVPAEAAKRQRRVLSSKSLKVQVTASAGPGREPEAAHLRSIVGLVWRSVVLWMLLLALLTLARLLG